jgi:hypothetical protein
MLLEPLPWRAPANTLCDMSAQSGQLDDAEPQSAVVDPRAEYLAHQKKVRDAVAPKPSLALRVIGWLLLGVTAVSFIATVISYLLNPQESGAVDLTLPTTVMVAGLATASAFVAPLLWEGYSVGVRVPNFVLVGILILVLIPLGTVLVVTVASLIADLLSNFV